MEACAAFDEGTFRRLALGRCCGFTYSRYSRCVAPSSRVGGCRNPRYDDKQMRRALILTIFLAFVALLAGNAARDFRLQTSMAHFISGATGGRLYDVGRRVADSSLSRQMLMTVGAVDTPTALAAARALGSRLQALDGISEVQSGIDNAAQDAFFELYFPHRYGLLFDEPELEVKRLEQSLEELAVDLRERLATPEGLALRRIIPEDPWSSFARLTERLQQQKAALELVEGQYVTQDGHGVIIAQLARSALDGQAQMTLLDQVRDAVLQTEADFPSIVVEQAGVNLFAVASEKAIKSDVQRVTVLSVLAVVILLLVVFRSVTQLLLATLPLLVGLLVATNACLLLFGELHALTLAFGGALIGVCIDYPVHLLNHHALVEATSPRASVATIWRGLALASGTTIIGLLGLGWTDFPGIREIAVFTAFGVLAALLATILVLPHVMPARHGATPTQRKLAELCSLWLDRVRKDRTPIFWLLSLSLAISAMGFGQLRFSERLRDLHEPDADLVRQDERVRGRLSSMDLGRLVVSSGPDEQSALRTNDAVALALENAIEADELEGYSSLHALLPSVDLQRRNSDALKTHPDLVNATLEALDRAGFDKNAFSPFVDSLTKLPEPLLLRDLEASPLAAWVRPFVVKLQDEVAIVTLLRGVRSSAALERRLDEIDGATYFDQAAALDESYRTFRRQVLVLMGFGLVFVLGLVALRYRNLRQTLAATTPALLAAAATVGTLATLRHELNLLHVLGLLLVLSIGVDYGIFLVEGKTDEHRSATLVSLVVACLTTVCSFGALAVSTIPALHALGVTIALGVLLSLVLAPSVLLFSQEAPHSSRGRARNETEGGS